MEFEFTAKDIAAGAVKPALLREELGEALGAPVEIYADFEGGALVKGMIRLADGKPLSADQQAAIAAVLASHDPTLPAADDIAAQQAQAIRQALQATDMAAIQQSIQAASDLDALRDGALNLSDVVIALRAIALGG